MGLKRSVLWSCVLLLVVGVGALLSKQQVGLSDEVVARVGDREITLGEVEEHWREIDAGSFMQVSQSRYDALALYLDMVVGNQILEIEAAGIDPRRHEMGAEDLGLEVCDGVEFRRLQLLTLSGFTVASGNNRPRGVRLNNCVGRSTTSCSNSSL